MRVPPGHFGDQSRRDGAAGRAAGSRLLFQHHITGGDAAERLFVDGIKRQDLFFEEAKVSGTSKLSQSQIGLDLPASAAAD